MPFFQLFRLKKEIQRRKNYLKFSLKKESDQKICLNYFDKKSPIKAINFFDQKEDSIKRKIALDILSQKKFRLEIFFSIFSTKKNSAKMNLFSLFRLRKISTKKGFVRILQQRKGFRLEKVFSNFFDQRNFFDKRKLRPFRQKGI